MTGDAPRRPLSARPVSARNSKPYSQLPRGLSIDEDHELVTEDLDTDSLSGFDLVAESGASGASGRPRSARPASARQIGNNVPSSLPRGRPIITTASEERDRVVVVGARTHQESPGPVRPFSASSAPTGRTYATLDRGTHQNLNLSSSTAPLETTTTGPSGQR